MITTSSENCSVILLLDQPPSRTNVDGVWAQWIPSLTADECAARGEGHHFQMTVRHCRGGHEAAVHECTLWGAAPLKLSATRTLGTHSDNKFLNKVLGVTCSGHVFSAHFVTRPRLFRALCDYTVQCTVYEYCRSISCCHFAGRWLTVTERDCPVHELCKAEQFLCVFFCFYFWYNEIL
jgi:hypothetical protein